jgi:acyl carrier protein
MDCSGLMDFIRETLKLEAVEPESAMGATFGWNSLKQVQLMLALERRYGVKIPADMIGELSSVKAIAAFLDAREGSGRE